MSLFNPEYATQHHEYRVTWISDKPYKFITETTITPHAQGFNIMTPTFAANLPKGYHAAKTLISKFLRDAAKQKYTNKARGREPSDKRLRSSQNLRRTAPCHP